MRRAVVDLVHFAWLELCSCVFAIGVFAGLLVAMLAPLPIARYDFLLMWCLALTFGFWAAGLETWREVLVIFAFHALGLGLEIFKVAQGSWVYPGDALTKVAGVPLFSGFMYAAVGSYICQAWRRFDLRVDHYRPVPVTLVAVGIYANFFTHHALPDVRVLLAVLMLVALLGCRVHFTVAGRRRWMPLSLAFVLIGFFLWVAENLATFLNAWRYPGQIEVWEVVHTSKWGSWALLVSMSFVLVATVKATEGVLYAGDGSEDQEAPRPPVTRPEAPRSATPL